ncbi:MAG: Asp-tRNA(Asn)/Glu-tRNA(Gln) amidotransferase subunit GatA [Candidatus Omnitrophica bacterium]|nr:Asp-tRNA(Asn)/Glu-tRNA(Gln) amidotransferase subunit GatA [Candidatus Omnitrophota bacterium]
MDSKDPLEKEKLYELTASGLLSAYERGQTNSSNVLSCFSKRIKQVDPKVKAFVKVIDKPQQENETGRLSGIPVAVKDNICIKGIETTCCSKILKGFFPPYNATVIEKLKKEGAIIIAKTNMDEFAFGSSTENSCFGLTRNPWDLECVSGGSSGGSAAAVASGQVPLALGSDTGGSIRQPASFCGVVGMKPTYGRVSRYGLVAFGSSLDQIGPFARDVSDLALLLSVISGYDDKDSTSVDVEVPDYSKFLVNDIRGLKIGIPKEYFAGSDGIAPEVKKAIEQAKETFEGLGAKVFDISLAHTKYAVSVYYIVATAEASSNLARFDGVQYGHRSNNSSAVKSQIIDMYKRTRSEGFGNEAKRRIMLGTFVLSSGYYDAYYLRAQKVRTIIRDEIHNALKTCDCIIAPTSPTTAFKIGERIDDPLKMYLSDIYTISANLAGVPAISLPCGFDSGNLPIGLQIMGAPFEEGKILRTAYTYEQNTPWHKKRPNI